MQLILVIESDPVWRRSMARHLRELPGVEVAEAGSFSDAIALISVEQPDLIVFDLDLDEPFQGEAFGHLQLPRLNVPMVFISARIESYHPFLADREDVITRKKPISLSELKRIVAERIGASGQNTPFGALEYAQLACLGKHSVAIKVFRDSTPRGTIKVHEGEIWSANTDTGQEGEVAIHTLALVPNASASCEELVGDPGPRNVEATWPEMLEETARARAEKTRKPTPA